MEDGANLRMTDGGASELRQVLIDALSSPGDPPRYFAGAASCVCLMFNAMIANGKDWQDLQQV